MCVLLVEDEAIILMVLQDVFVEAGHQVMSAATVAEGVLLLEQHPGHFSAVVTDFHTPGGLHGGHLIERVRHTYPDIPVILATATRHAITPEWRKQYSVELVEKPYSPDAVVTRVKRLLAAG